MKTKKNDSGNRQAKIMKLLANPRLSLACSKAFEKDLGEVDLLEHAALLEFMLPRVCNAAVRGERTAVDMIFKWSSILAEAVCLCAKDNPYMAMKFVDEYRNAWPVVNGKPVPGYPAKCKLIRRGKHNFESRATKTVADTLKAMHDEKRYGVQKADVIRLRNELHPDRKMLHELNAKIFELPTLTQKTRGAWWKIMRRIIKDHPGLSKAELDHYREWTSYATDSEAVEQFLKICKERFYKLCP